MFPALLQQTASLSRDKAVGTNGRQALTQLYTGVACLVMPMNNTTIIEHKFNIGRAFDIYFSAGQDVAPGDQLTVGSNTYTIKAVKSYTEPLIGYTMAMAEQVIS